MEPFFLATWKLSALKKIPQKEGKIHRTTRFFQRRKRNEKYKTRMKKLRTRSAIYTRSRHDFQIMDQVPRNWLQVADYSCRFWDFLVRAISAEFVPRARYRSARKTLLEPPSRRWEPLTHVVSFAITWYATLSTLQPPARPFGSWKIHAYANIRSLVRGLSQRTQSLGWKFPDENFFLTPSRSGIRYG